MKYYILGVGV